MTSLSSVDFDFDLDPPGGAARRAGVRVVVAMSGGVDSSVAAAVLTEAGYDVVGLTMQLYDAGTKGRGKTCCARQDVYDARRVADRLGIPHYVADYEAAFLNDVVTAFADSYASGETPIPCVSCNQTVKFRDLLQTAKELGAAALATGHYARRRRGPGGACELWRGRDPRRDQSYFLYAVTRGQLADLRFPLGELSKDETRALARRHGLDVAEKPDSQDICFVPDGDYARVVLSLRPDAAEPGDIVDLGGQVLGRHAGIVHYTVGQRRGLELGGLSEPLYVARIEPDSRRVVVGPRSALATNRVLVRSLNWLGDEDAPPPEGMRVAVKVRNSSALAEGVIRSLPQAEGGEALAEVLLDAPVEGAAPGQACVCYDGERVLGGGWIARRSGQN